MSERIKKAYALGLTKASAILCKEPTKSASVVGRVKTHNQKVAEKRASIRKALQGK